MFLAGIGVASGDILGYLGTSKKGQER